MPPRPPLRDDVTLGWAYAFGLSCIAAVPLLLLGLLSLGERLLGLRPEVDLREWLFLDLTVVASYFVAATLVAPLFWIARPLRHGFFGFAFSGALIAPVVYGSVAFVVYIAWEPAGRLLFGAYNTRAEFLTLLPILMAAFAGIGAIVGLWQWREYRSGAG